jgi:DNA primase
MPLLWDELDSHLDPRDFTIATASRRLEELGNDPLRGVLAGGNRLGASLSRLAKRLTNPEDED